MAHRSGREGAIGVLPATAIRDRLGECPEVTNPPLVSIVVLNRNGREHLNRLLAGLIERTEYPRLELIVVDNGSSDGSLDFLRRAQAPFPLSIIANQHNESFSDANNQGAKLATGELLLLLNNDVEPLEPGWLLELVACQRRTGAGAVAALLVDPPTESDTAAGPRVQTWQARLRADSEAFTADFTSGRAVLQDEMFGKEIETAIAIGACLLVKRGLFNAVGGLTHGYFYGGEDEDLCLKLRERGASTFHCGRSVLVHYGSSTSRELHGERGGRARRSNGLLLLSHWAPRLWRELQLDLLRGAELWAAPGQEPAPDCPSEEEALAYRFCLIADSIGDEGERLLAALEGQLTRRGHRHVTLRNEAACDPTHLFYDIVIYLRGDNRYVPSRGRLNVLWLVDPTHRLSALERRCYDLVVTTDEAQAARLTDESVSTPVIASEPGREVGALIDAVHRRATQVRLPTRIQADWASMERRLSSVS